MLRALILATLGIPVCAALFTGAVTFVLFSYGAGEPPDAADLAGALMFGGLSLVVVLLALRASRREDSVAPMLSRAAPVLLLLGAIGGAWATVAISRDHLESLAASREDECHEYLEDRATEAAMTTCLREVRTCEQKVREDDSGRSTTILIQECLAKRVGALELMGKVAETPHGPADEAVKPVYPAEVENVPPVVDRLCDLLHGLPKRRRAECCQKKPGVILTRECVRNLTGALADGAVTLADVNVDACENAMKSAHETCDWVGPRPPGVPEACLGLLRGTRKLNDACRSSLECQHGLRCVGSGPTEPGHCAKPGAIGSPCNTSVDTLAVYVRQDDVNRRHPACSDGFCERNRCVEKIRSGGACKANDQCLFGRCADGRCVDERTADVGEACLGGDCIEGTRCIGGKCAELKGLGADCTKNAECRAACVDGKCALGCEDAPLLKKLSPPPAPAVTPGTSAPAKKP